MSIIPNPLMNDSSDDADKGDEMEPVKKVSIICSKGTLDMAYPGLILANAARMSGIEATLFFTFWGMDIITKSKYAKLKVPVVGNPSMHPSMPIPTMIGSIPFMCGMASGMMRKEIAKLDIPTVPELMSDLHDAGAEMYACRMAMDMFKLKREDLIDEIDEVIGAMEFYDHSAGAQIIFI